MHSYRIHINGLVQGVGFRPFVYKSAQQLSINGHVYNSGNGVYIEITCTKLNLDIFTDILKNETPPLSKIETFSVKQIDLKTFTKFEITSSQSPLKNTTISADVSICETCLSELTNPQNRRYKYPFINCTDCGPRYSISRTIPYDRINTSMASFPMCNACEAEYRDPNNRRYHAQAICCSECGPQVSCLEPNGKSITTQANAIKATIEALKQGKIVAVKGIGGFHLMCDANNTIAVQKLRHKKNRPLKPFTVMFKDMDQLKKSASFSDYEKHWLISPTKPIVLLPLNAHHQLSFEVAPDLNKVGAFLPYTPLHFLLFEALDFPLVATSANRSGSPMLHEVSQVIEQLNDVVDLILNHDRDIKNRVDDSVLQTIDTQTIILRQARGLSPYTIPLLQKVQDPILAIGAHQKSSIAYAFKDKLVLSPYIGDLNTIKMNNAFEETITCFSDFYDIQATQIVHDKHPHFFSTQWAQNQHVQTRSVQHHYAHVLALLADHQLTETVLGFTYDGVGYGDDKTVWGGETFIADVHTYKRVATFKPFRLLGGDKANQEPRRVALALLFECFTLTEVLTLNIPTIKAFNNQEIQLHYQAWQKGINAPLCSSVGRLFDGVASLCGVIQILNYEGESGLRLEGFFDELKNGQAYNFTFENATINWHTMIKQIILEPNRTKAITRFFHTLVAMIDSIASMHPNLPVALTGGVFQNQRLTQLLLHFFAAKNRKCYIPTHSATNDGSIALGQLWYAIHNQNENNKCY
jgi:hydrogenase maturation protein HypF